MRPVGGLLRDAAAVLAVFAALGVLGGVVWELLVTPAMYTKTELGATMPEFELDKRFDTDGWYAVVAAVTAIPAAGVLTWWRSRDPVATTLLVVLGSVVAAAVMALTGWLLGPPHPDAVLAAADLGAEVPVQLTVTAPATYLLWPFGAVVGALTVLWSSSGQDTADRHGRRDERAEGAGPVQADR